MSLIDKNIGKLCDSYGPDECLKHGTVFIYTQADHIVTSEQSVLLVSRSSLLAVNASSQDSIFAGAVSLGRL